MKRKPKCVIVTGRPGSGKTTLSKNLGQRLWMPVISRDEIKEGYVNTFGVKHDQLPSNTNEIVSNFFFDIVYQFLANNVSVIIEAAFQHEVWESRMPKILEVSDPYFVICSIETEIAAARHLQRGLTDSSREFYHGDKRVSEFLATGEIGPPADYTAPDFDLPTISVSTENDYVPDIDEIVSRLYLDTAQSR